MQRCESRHAGGSWKAMSSSAESVSLPAFAPRGDRCRIITEMALSSAEAEGVVRRHKPMLQEMVYLLEHKTTNDTSMLRQRLAYSLTSQVRDAPESWRPD